MRKKFLVFCCAAALAVSAAGCSPAEKAPAQEISDRAADRGALKQKKALRRQKGARRRWQQRRRQLNSMAL